MRVNYYFFHARNSAKYICLINFYYCQIVLKKLWMVLEVYMMSLELLEFCVLILLPALITLVPSFNFEHI